jgi:hypothetical protein
MVLTPRPARHFESRSAGSPLLAQGPLVRSARCRQRTKGAIGDAIRVRGLNQPNGGSIINMSSIAKTSYGNQELRNCMMLLVSGLPTASAVVKPRGAAFHIWSPRTACGSGGLDLELPVRSNIEKECHFGPDRQKGLNDPVRLTLRALVLPRATKYLGAPRAATDATSPDVTATTREHAHSIDAGVTAFGLSP